MRAKLLLNEPSSTLRRAHEDEPCFVLRGQDASAAALVRAWAELNRATISEEKYQDALEVAAAMERWRPQRPPT